MGWLGVRTDYDTYISFGPLSGYDFGFFLDGYTYHTPLDDISTIQQGVLQEFGDNLNMLIRHILTGDVHKIDDDPLIYFDLLGRYLVVYKKSTSILLQHILIISSIVVGIILLICNEICHRRRSFECRNSRCINICFKYPLLIRILLITTHVISYLIAALVGLLFSMIIAAIMSITRPFALFGNSTLAILIFSFPCLIGSTATTYLSNIFHRCIGRKLLRNSCSTNRTHVNGISFEFEQNLSVVLAYGCLMLASIHADSRLLYITLVWSIFICPTYLLLITLEFVIHWKEIHCRFFKENYHWLYLPFIICLLPLTHTIEIVCRLIRSLMPILMRRYSSDFWSFAGNQLICCIIVIPTLLFALIFIPLLQRIKCLGRLLIILSITFVIIAIVTYTRQPFTKTHPHAFYAKHTSNSIFKIGNFSQVPVNVSQISQSSSITVLSLGGAPLSSVLDEFSVKTGHILENKKCFSQTNCSFDDTFNRTLAVQAIQIESMKNFVNYTVVVRHVLSYNIAVSSSSSFIHLIIRDQITIPRTETIIDIIVNLRLYSFSIDINIRRCDLSDSPFLLSLTRSIPNIVPVGDASCHAIEDNTKLVVGQDILS